MDIFVDKIRGNDTNGNGSEENPFASLEHALTTTYTRVLETLSLPEEELKVNLLTMENQDIQANLAIEEENVKNPYVENLRNNLSRAISEDIVIYLSDGEYSLSERIRISTIYNTPAGRSIQILGKGKATTLRIELLGNDAGAGVENSIFKISRLVLKTQDGVLGHGLDGLYTAMIVEISNVVIDSKRRNFLLTRAPESIVKNSIKIYSTFDGEADLRGWSGIDGANKLKDSYGFWKLDRGFSEENSTVVSNGEMLRLTSGYKITDTRVAENVGLYSGDFP